MSVMTRRTVLWALVAAWAAVIFAFSSIPGSNVPGRYGSLAHFTEYALLGGLLYHALRVDRSPAVAYVVATIVASAYGLTDEFHQSFVPLRVPDAMDWLIDTVGALSGATISAAAGRLASLKRRSES